MSINEDSQSGSTYVQESLFDVGPDEEVGYRVPIACQVAGITYRQLDYWARTNLVNPSIRTARGSGSQRLYSFKDVLVLKIVKRLLDTGISCRISVWQLSPFGIVVSMTWQNSPSYPMALPFMNAVPTMR